MLTYKYTYSHIHTYTHPRTHSHTYSDTHILEIFCISSVIVSGNFSLWLFRYSIVQITIFDFRFSFSFSMIIKLKQERYFTLKIFVRQIFIFDFCKILFLKCRHRHSLMMIFHYYWWITMNVLLLRAATCAPMPHVSLWHRFVFLSVALFLQINIIDK